MTVQIDPKATIGGLPILRVRHALRRPGPNGYRVWSLAADLKISKHVARRFASRMEREGYLERAELEDDTEPAWQLTEIGLALASGRATPRIHRATAERLLAGLIERMHLLETRTDLLYRVEQAYVYGSYLRTVDRLGDLDVAVKLAPREADRALHRERARDRVWRVRQEGRRFSNITEELFFPKHEVWRFLRGRSRSISLRDLDEEPDLVPVGGVRVIYPLAVETADGRT